MFLQERSRRGEIVAIAVVESDRNGVGGNSAPAVCVSAFASPSCVTPQAPAVCASALASDSCASDIAPAVSARSDTAAAPVLIVPTPATTTSNDGAL